MFVLIVLEVWERHIITLGCGLLTLVLVFGLGMHSMSAVLETLNLGSFFTSHFWYTAGQSAEASSGINWETIVFVAGMMIMVEGMARVGFFRWLCMRLAKMVKYMVVPLFVTFMVLSGILAMFIDSITVILFLAAVTIELSQLLKFNPVPMILAEVFCANLGGSATMCGDPPNIIIGTSLGYSFTDFLTNTGVIAGVSLVVVVLYSIWYSTRNCVPVRQLQQAATRPTRILPKPLPIKRIYYQHYYFPVCGSSAGDPRTNRSDRILYWCIHFYRDFNCSRQGRTETDQTDRLQDPVVLHRTVHGSGWPGADRHPESYGEFHRRHQQRQSDADDRYYPVDLCDCQRLRG